MHDLPGKIQQLVENIEYLQVNSSTQLISLVSESEISLKNVREIANHDHPVENSYGRKMLYKGKNFVVFLMTWNQNDFTAIHSHGSTDWGCVYFLGKIDHRLYNAHDLSITLVNKSIIPGCTIVPVTGTLIHAMGNLDREPSYSLHIYGSGSEISIPNDGAFVYEIEKKQIRETDGSASINIPESVCKSTLKGLKTDEETLLDYLNIVLPYYVKNGNQKMIELIKNALNQPNAFIH